MLDKRTLRKTFLFLAFGGVILTSAIIIPERTLAEPTSFGHRTNKGDVQRDLENGWIVIYSKEFSHEEYLKLSSVIAADIAGGSGTATSAYFTTFAEESLSKILQEATRKAPSIIGEIRRELTIPKILSAIRTSFDGKRVSLSIAGMDFQIGRATYNRAECARIKECAVPKMGQTGCARWIRTPWGSRECLAPTFGQVGCDRWIETSTSCIPTPNTYQPYIRFRVARSNSNSGSSTNSTNPNSSVSLPLPPGSVVTSSLVRVVYRLNDQNGGYEIFQSIGNGQWKSQTFYPGFSPRTYLFQEVMRTSNFVQLQNIDGNHNHVRLYGSYWESWTGLDNGGLGWRTWPWRTGSWIK